MSTNYPYSVDNLTTTFADVTDQAGVHAPHHNNLAAAVKAIETYTKNGWGWKPTAYGAFGDGNSHPITSADVTAHNEWIGTYAAGDEWDYVGIQEAIYHAFATSSTHGNVVWNGSSFSYFNRPVYITSGKYLLNKTLTINSLVGGRIYGDGRFATQLLYNGPTNSRYLVATNSCAYSRFDGILFSANGVSMTGYGLFNLDWDGSTAGLALQGNTFSDCFFDCTSTADYGLLIGWSGFMGSENLLLDCHLQSAKTAGLYIGNFNALQNTMVGGNIQACLQWGIQVHRGNVVCYSVGFQNGTYDQVGADVLIEASANDASLFHNCRSESWKFLSQGSSSHGHTVHMQNIRMVSAPTTTRSASTAYSLNATVAPNGFMYRVTTAGTTSSGATPAFDGTTSFTDGTVVWTLQDFPVVEIDSGTVRDCALAWGYVNALDISLPVFFENCVFSRYDWPEHGGKLPFATTNRPAMWAYMNCQVRPSGSPNGSDTPLQWTPSVFWFPGRDPNNWHGAFPTYGALNLGANPLLFSTGDPNTSYGEVGLVRGDGTTAGDITRNILALIGALGQITPSGTNLAGADTYIYGGLSTGTGAPGSIHLGTASAGSTGTTVNLAADAVTIRPGKSVQISTPASAPTDANLANGQVAMYLDEVGNNLKIRVKYSNGTLKTATIALV